MMKRLLFGAATAALLAFSTPSAQAQFGPGSIVHDPINYAAIAENLGVSQEQLAQLVSSYNSLRDIFATATAIDDSVMKVYGQAANIYLTLQGLTNINGFAGILHLPGMQNPMPFSSSAASGFFSGATSPSGLPFGSVFAAANTVGQLPGEVSFMASQITRSVNAISSFQATAANNLQALENRAAALPDIGAQLDTARTVKETDDITARLQAEQNYATLQNAQATNLAVSAQMSLAAQQERERQALYQHNQARIASSCAVAGQAGPACRTDTLTMTSDQ